MKQVQTSMYLVMERRGVRPRSSWPTWMTLHTSIPHHTTNHTHLYLFWQTVFLLHILTVLIPQSCLCIHRDGRSSRGSVRPHPTPPSTTLHQGCRAARAVVSHDFFEKKNWFFLNFFNGKNSPSRTKKVPCRFLFLTTVMSICNWCNVFLATTCVGCTDWD